MTQLEILYNYLKLDSYVPECGYITWGYYGIPDVGSIYINEWADSKIVYENRVFNEPEIIDGIWESYREEYGTEEGFDGWLMAYPDRLIEELEEAIFLGLGKDRSEFGEDDLTVEGFGF